MANLIGKPVMVAKLNHKVNVPQLLVEIATSEKHNHLLMAVSETGNLLQLLAERTIQVGDPPSIQILARMGLLHPKEPEKEYEDI